MEYSGDAHPRPNHVHPVLQPPVYIPLPTIESMPAPQRPAGCPPGLEYLTQIDQLLIHQQTELIEKENDCCTRNWCGPMRPFTIKVLDNYGQEVLTLSRPLKCVGCCCPCCLQELEVQAPPGNPIGYVIQDWHPLKPKFTIQNERKEPVLKMEGPCCDCKCCSDTIFEVKSVDEAHVVGKICKQWTGFFRETFTDADNFGIQFPMDLDVKIKAVMIGACFLIDFIYFEDK